MMTVPDDKKCKKCPALALPSNYGFCALHRSVGKTPTKQASYGHLLPHVAPQPPGLLVPPPKNPAQQLLTLKEIHSQLPAIGSAFSALGYGATFDVLVNQPASKPLGLRLVRALGGPNQGTVVVEGVKEQWATVVQQGDLLLSVDGTPLYDPNTTTMKDVLDLIQGLSQKTEEGGSVTEEGDATASATSADADKDAASSDSEGKAGKEEDKIVNTSSGGDKDDDSKEDDNDSDAPPKKKAKTVKVAMLLRFWRPTQQPMPQLPPPPNPMLNSYALPTSASLFKAAVGDDKTCKSCPMPALKGNYGFCNKHRAPRKKAKTPAVSLATKAAEKNEGEEGLCLNCKAYGKIRNCQMCKIVEKEEAGAEGSDVAEEDN